METDSRPSHEEEAKEIMAYLNHGLDTTRKLIEQEHDFEEKLHMVDLLFYHIMQRYGQYRGLTDSFTSIFNEIDHLRHRLKEIENHTIWIRKEEEGIGSEKGAWNAVHAHMHEVLQEEEKVTYELLNLIHGVFQRILQHITESEVTLYHEEQKKVKVMESSLLEMERKELEECYGSLYNFSRTYEHFFNDMVRKEEDMLSKI